MAERATADRVAADMKPPNYRGAVQRLRTIKPKKERIAGINGEISGIYDTVEGFKVNKKAAKIFMALDGLEGDEQQDIFRSLTGLIDAAGWSTGDLVDQAEGAAPGNIVTPNFGRRAPADGEGSAPDLDETLAEVETMQPDVPTGETGETGQVAVAPTEPEPKPKSERLSPTEARKRAKQHFGEGKAPPPSGQAESEPYTGDNADLAGE